MVESRRYYCQIRVDTSFNAGNLPKQNIDRLNEKIEEAISNWSMEMQEKGLSLDVGWNWSEHCDLKSTEQEG